MRPLRLTIFLGSVIGLLAAVVYLWRPLIVPNLPNAHFTRHPVPVNPLPSVDVPPQVLMPPPTHREPPPTSQHGLPAGELVLKRVPPVISRLAATELPVAPGGPSISAIGPGARLSQPGAVSRADVLRPPPSSRQDRP